MRRISVMRLPAPSLQALCSSKAGHANDATLTRFSSSNVDWRLRAAVRRTTTLSSDFIYIAKK